MQSIGWIGVGIMGGPMVRNLLKAGFEVHITARNRAKVEEVIQAGAVFHDTIAGCVQGRQAVVTMVGYPQDVEEVYFAPGNILDQAAPGTYLIDMTTTSPTLAQRLAVEGAKRGFRVLDAPVTGGDVGAKAGTLSGLCEALAYAQAKGLDGRKLLGALATGAAGSRQLDTLGEKILTGDDAPGFYLKHFVKDLGLAQDEARDSGLTLEVLGQALANCADLEGQGLGDRGTQALIHHYQNPAGR